MGRYGADWEGELNCPTCGEALPEIKAGIGYPDAGAGLTSTYIDYIEPEVVRCQHCGKDHDTDHFADEIMERYEMSLEPDYEELIDQ